MIFCGISRKFSTVNDGQYQTIGEFWDFCSSIYGRENLKGLGYNWTPDSIEYVIGRKDDSEMDDERIAAKYPDAVSKCVLLPEMGWKRYSGRTEQLGELYGEIYADGSLSYEIEMFSDDGSCEVQVTREWPELCLLTEEDIDEVFSIYKRVIGTEFCVWSDSYPTREILLEDIRESCLYGIKDDAGRIVAAVARDRDPEVENLSVWTKKYQPGAELARLVVAPEYQNQGMARVLLRQGMKKLKELQFASIHFLVAKKNKKAIRSYSALGFTNVGETYMFNEYYDCYEMELK